MTLRRSAGVRLRLGAALVPAIALATTGMVATGAGAVTPERGAAASDEATAASGAWINYVQPRAEKAFGTDKQVGKQTADARHDAIAKAMEVDRKNAKGNPVTARQLAMLEAKAIKTGLNPKQIKSQYKGAKATQEARLLTILVEFNENGNDDFSGAYVPSEYGSETCVPGTVQNGPLHNNIPNPADAPLLDNNSMWVPDFSPQHFDNMLYTKTGLTQRVRTDLTGPDGQPGFDISGYTMKNMYEEMSKG